MADDKVRPFSGRYDDSARRDTLTDSERVKRMADMAGSVEVQFTLPSMNKDLLASISGPLMQVLRQRLRRIQGGLRPEQDDTDWYGELGQAVNLIGQEVADGLRGSAATPEYATRLTQVLIEAAEVCVAWVEHINRREGR